MVDFFECVVVPGWGNMYEKISMRMWGRMYFICNSYHDNLIFALFVVFLL